MNHARGRVVASILIGTSIIVGFLWITHRDTTLPVTSPPQRSSSVARSPSVTSTPVAVVPVIPAPEAEPPVLPAPSPADEDGWHVVGRVAGIDGGRIANASVRVQLRAWNGDISEWLGSARTGSDGRYAVDVTTLRNRCMQFRSLCDLTIRAEAKGFVPAVSDLASLPPTGADRATIPLDARLEVGACVRGRMVDASGQGVAHGLVELVRVGPVGLSDEPHRKGTVVGNDVTELDGSFAIEIERPGTYRLRAQATDVGLGSSHLISLPVPKDVDVSDIVLGAGDSIEGLVRFADGSAAEGVFVKATSTIAERAKTENRNGYGLARQVDDAGGLDEAFVATDAQGRFRLSGLATGLYSVRVGYDIFENHRTGERELAFTIGDRWCWFHVHIRDESGRPLPGASVGYIPISPDADCTEVVEASADGVVQIAVDRETRMRVSVSGEGFTSEGIILEAKERRFAEDVDLVLHRQDALPGPVDACKGHVRLSVRGEHGERVSDVHGTARETTSGRHVSFALHPEDEGLLPPLECGVWQIWGEAGSTPSEMFFPIDWGSATVDSDGETSLSQVAATGGRVRLIVTIPPESRERELIVTRLRPELADRNSWAGTFERFWDAERGAWQPISRLQSGVPCVLDLVLKSGTYDLAFAADRFREVEVPFGIDAGRTTDVAILLQPE